MTYPTDHQTSNTTRSMHISFGKLLQAGLIAIAVATVANIAVYYVATSLLNFQMLMPTPSGTNETLIVGAVLAATAIGGAGATLVYGMLARFAANPATLFRIVSIVALVLSFGLLLVLPQTVTLETRLVLGLMHMVACAAIAGLLPVRGGTATTTYRTR